MTSSKRSPRAIYLLSLSPRWFLISVYRSVIVSEDGMAGRETHEEIEIARSSSSVNKTPPKGVFAMCLHLRPLSTRQDPPEQIPFPSPHSSCVFISRFTDMVSLLSLPNQKALLPSKVETRNSIF